MGTRPIPGKTDGVRQRRMGRSRGPQRGRHATMTVMIAAFSITPLGGGESVGASVAEAVRLVRRSALPNETNAMFTNVEGEWEEVMSLIKGCAR